MTLNETEFDPKQALTDMYPVIQRAAKSVAFQWPGVVEADEVTQDIWLRLWESPGSILRVSEMEDRAKYRALVGIGHQLASQERTDYDHFKGSYKYSVDEVKKLLARGVLIEPLEGFNDSVFDLMEGLGAMVKKTPQYVEAVVSRYADNETPSSSREQDALKNGLTKLANAMNKSNRVRFSERDDGIGTRKVRSNSAARNLSEFNETGDLAMSSENWDGVDGQ